MWIERAAAARRTAAPHAGEPGRHAAGRVCAPVVPGDDLDVLVPVAAIHRVLDAEVWELTPAVAVRQIVIERPFCDLPVGSTGPAVAVGATAVVLLEPLLILAPEIDFQHDSSDLAASVAQL